MDKIEGLGYINMKPVKKTSYHHGDLRQSIINAVALLIKEKKGINFQLKEVAELVGTSQPAIYKHFDGKKELLTEVAVAGYKLQSEFREKSLKEANDSPLAQLMSVGESYINFARTHSGYFLLIKNLETKEILSSIRYLAERAKTVKRIEEITRNCITQGLFIDIEIELAGTALNASAIGLAHLIITGQIEVTSQSFLNDRTFYKQVFELHVTSLLSDKGKIAFRKL